MTNFRFGLLAEYFIIMLYRCKLYNILAHREKNFAGEIDIIAKRRNSLVFIEVKARSSLLDDKFCLPKQQKRIIRGAEVFLHQNPCYAGLDIRFDLALVMPYSIPRIIENAW